MSSNHITFLISVATVYTMLAISPGPNFLVITQAAASRSRAQALSIALGVSTASVIWASLAAMGLGIILSQFLWLQRVLQILGGCYLFYTGLRILFNARSPLNTVTKVIMELNNWQAYQAGLTTNLANPKTLMFFTSVFAGLFSEDLTVNVRLGSVLIVAAISIAWNVLMVTVFSINSSRLLYARKKVWIDTVVGVLILYFSVKLIAGY